MYYSCLAGYLVRWILYVHFDFAISSHCFSNRYCRLRYTHTERKRQSDVKRSLSVIVSQFMNDGWMERWNDGVSTDLHKCSTCTSTSTHPCRFQCDAMRLDWIENFWMGPRMIVCLFALLAVGLTSMWATPSIWHCLWTSTLWISPNFNWCAAHTIDDTLQNLLPFVRLWNIFPFALTTNQTLMASRNSINVVCFALQFV